MVSITKSVRDWFDLKSFNSCDRRKINIIIFSYLLGLQSYSKTSSTIREFGLKMYLPNFLKSLTQQEIDYILKKLRAKVNKRDVKVFKRDAKTLQKLSKFLSFKEVKVVEYPSIEEVYASIFPTVLNVSHKFYKSLTLDPMLNSEDLTSELVYKVLQTYKLYIYSFGLKNFNNKVFYSCLLRSMSTRKVDILRNMIRKGNKINLIAKKQVESNTFIGHFVQVNQVQEPVLGRVCDILSLDRFC